MTGLAALLAQIAQCRICRDTQDAPPLPHEPRPVVVASDTARLLICGQAPGARVHASGKPFTDPSGERLRAWLGLSEAQFYDAARVSIVPMGFCFPGHDAKGGDLPPRKECAATWHHDLFALMPQIELVVAVGQYGQKWHLAGSRKKSLTETVRTWPHYGATTPPVVPLPHPSWRNNGWLKRNPWFEVELLPDLRRRIACLGF
ncbi:MAG: uracil-DNA glycosylase family protein [Alphaproteobacteria bacterium]